MPFHSMFHRHGRRFAHGKFGRCGAGHPHGHDQHAGEGRHGGGHHGGGRHGGGRRSGRVFDHGELRLVVLALIAEKPRHGYELIKEIEDRLAGTYSPSPGVIYPTLTMLEELGHATVTEEDGKKRYTVTTQGTEWLAANQSAVDAALARIDAVGHSHGGGFAPQVIRAMENLKLSLRMRRARGPLSEEQIRVITDALDNAARDIERC